MVSRGVVTGREHTRIVPALLVLLFTLGITSLFSPRVAHAAQLSLSWIDNSGGTAAFNVERKTDTTGTYGLLVTISPGVTTYVDSTVTAGTTYCYRVMAVRGASSSEYSNEACGTPASGSAVTVTMSGSGWGTVTSSPAGISCPGTCSASFSTGTVVTLTAAAASGSSFGGWSGSGCAGTAPCVLTGNASVSVTALFSLNGTAPSPSISVSATSVAPGGSLTATLSNSPGGSTDWIGLAPVGSADTTYLQWVYVGAGVTNRTWTVTVPSTPGQYEFRFYPNNGYVVAARSRAVTVSAGGVDPASLTLSYNGQLRDRVGQGNTALGPEGALDGTLTATLSASGGRTITALQLQSTGPGVWDTGANTQYWVLGVAATLDGSLLNDPTTVAVNFPVANGGSFVLFASDYQGIEFVPGATLTLTATFSDGTTATAATPVPASATLALAYNGQLRDRVGQGNTALGPDGAPDGTLTVTLKTAGGKTVTALRLDSTAPGTWDTSSGDIFWVLGVAATLDGPLLNAPGTMAVNFPVPEGGSFVVFAADYLGREFLSGNTLTVTATFSDGSTASSSTTVP